ncbi:MULTISPECIES: DUF2273 domain-containing protein [Paenibacillus]|uniref:Membrane protein n=2 Tax=Paenibacillus TaxID=44249 RepID=A0AAP5H3E9_PAEAM|nr:MULTISPECIES: DUF2273 domain-containing protein [Paenibacillus]KQY87664.1 hypothetical protein ASD24_07455 [Paenibacillus sp. Root52]MCG7375678.1 DUF2273 domain-containing protein [Paenibacillus sp. ACRSA]MDQ0168978.1 putative membrane protein [Paenibacillus tundrae]MDR6725157.1 putative membrane protein [Paenibacillus amylolyticus]
MLWREIWDSHRGRVLGIAFGIFFGFLYVWIGFWDMLFFALLVFIGYTLGRRSDSKLGSFIPWREWGQWLGDRWRMFK